MVENSKPLWIKKEKPIGIFVATPVHSDVSIHYTQTLLEFQKECMKKGIRVMFQLMKSSLVTQGRNLCVSSFLQSDYTHLLFVDSDICFETSSIFKMLESDKDIISQPYPLKTAKWDTLHKKIKDGRVSNAKEYHVNINQYPLLLKEDDNDISMKDGIVEATHCPTGCMLIKRQVFDKLIKEYPNMDIKQKTVINGKMLWRPHFYAFFDTFYDSETKRYLGEDFAFCRLWRNIGGKLYCYIMDYITHVGEFQFTGRLFDEMTNKQEVEKPCDSE
jgi:hypothetical protein